MARKQKRSDVWIEKLLEQIRLVDPQDYEMVKRTIAETGQWTREQEARRRGLPVAAIELEEQFNQRLNSPEMQEALNEILNR